MPIPQWPRLDRSTPRISDNGLLASVAHGSDGGSEVMGNTGDCLLGVVRSQVARDAGLALLSRIMAPPRFQRWCDVDGRYPAPHRPVLIQRRPHLVQQSGQTRAQNAENRTHPTPTLVTGEQASNADATADQRRRSWYLLLVSSTEWQTCWPPRHFGHGDTRSEVHASYPEARADAQFMVVETRHAGDKLQTLQVMPSHQPRIPWAQASVARRLGAAGCRKSGRRWKVRSGNVPPFSGSRMADQLADWTKPGIAQAGKSKDPRTQPSLASLKRRPRS